MDALEHEGYRYTIKDGKYCLENDCGEVMLIESVGFIVKGDELLDHGPVETVKKHLERLKLVYRSCGKFAEAASLKLVTGNFDQTQINKMLESKKYCRRLARLH